MADYKREPAIRLFAAEIAKTTIELERSSSDQFATVYAVSPTGAKINRIFHIGTLTEIEEGDNDFVRGRVVDPTGAVHIRAGTYQPE
ncbi:MAG: DNA-binding protein, partial [Methanomicrobiales archaeon HGW-Methanomicrobiales-5]